MSANLVFRRLTVFLALCLLVLSYYPSPLQAQPQVKIRTVALFSEPAPGTEPGTTFTDLESSLPVISTDGRVAFLARLVGGGVTTANRYGVWAENADTVLQLVVRAGSPAPGTSNGVFLNFQPTFETIPNFLSNGEVVFRASASPDSTISTSNRGGVWSAGNLISLRAIAFWPYGSPGNYIINISAPRATRSGVVMVSASTWPSTPQRELMLRSGADFVLTTLFDDSTAVVGAPENYTASGMTNFLTSADGSVLGMVSFSAFQQATVYSITSNRSGVLQMEYSSQQAPPGGNPGEKFDRFYSIATNSSGALALHANLTLNGLPSNGQGLWAEQTGALTLVARRGMPAPGTGPGVTFATFGTFSMTYSNMSDFRFTDAGDVIFRAVLQGTGVTTANDVGLWKWRNGAIDLLAREGDPVPGLDSGIVFRELDQIAVNTLGDLVFTSTIQGPGVTTANDNCLFLVNRFGELFLILREGAQIEVRPGDIRTLRQFTFASFGGVAATGVDGRPTVFNENGELPCKFGFSTTAHHGYFVVNVNEFLPTRRPVKVLNITSTGSLVPVPSTEFETGFYYGGPAAETPYHLLQFRTTDSDGILYLDSTMYQPGDQFIVVHRAYEHPSPKSGREPVDYLAYEIWIDNLAADTIGRYYPDSLHHMPGGLTTTTLLHSTIRINLIVSVEWPAQTAYMDSLVQMFRKASLYLYDVTNGQACLGKVAIYDNGVKWDDADIQIHAKNTKHPAALINGLVKPYGHILLPPKWFGHPVTARNQIHRENPINPNHPFTYRALAHELGHYALIFFDEYKDIQKRPIHPDINFGFMDNAYPDPTNSDPMRSEMSFVVTPEYQQTAHFAVSGRSCWQDFHDTFSKTYGSVWVKFRTPEDAPRPAGKDYVPGPNDNVDIPDVAIDRTMTITRTATGSTAAGRLIRAFVDGRPLRDAEVRLKKTALNRIIHQGTTSTGGRLRYLGADLGDSAYISYTGPDKKVFQQIFPVAPLLFASSTPRAHSTLDAGGFAGEEEDLTLQQIGGEFRFLSAVDFDPSGAQRFIVRTNRNFITPPTVELLRNNTPPVSYMLTGDSTGYQVTFTDSLHAAQELLFRAPDSLGAPFFAFHPHEWSTVDSTKYEIIGGVGDYLLTLDSTSFAIERISILGSSFPSPDNGIPPGHVRISPVFAIHQYPSSANLAGLLSITYTELTSTEEATIYRWNDTWVPLKTIVDTTRSRATASIESPGFYAVYIDSSTIIILDNPDTGHGQVPEGFRLEQNYPNPFNPSTTIKYQLPTTSAVSLHVYDLLGRKVATLVEEVRPAGNHEVAWDASGMATGVYFYRLQAGGFVETRKLILLR